MHLLILTAGTRGDVQPYVALGRGMRASGHTVTICAPAHFEHFITEHGLAYAFLNNDIIDLMHSEEGQLAMENTGTLWETILTMRRIMPKMGALQRHQIEDFWAAAETTNPDLILFHPKALGAPDFAEYLGLPCMLGFYLPMYVPTRAFPAMGFPQLPFGGWYNRLTYHCINLATWLGTGRYINEWREARGLPRRRGGAYLQRADGFTIPALHAYSPAIIPHPADWPPSAVTTGYWFLDQEDTWQPPDALQAFLAAGEPPVYVGFGSIFGRDPARLTRIVVEAVQAAGVRAVLAQGWGGLILDGFNLPDTIFPIEVVPHDWLFPRVSAVVHHGGCGTTAAGLRAGRPTVVCPLFGDQPFWGAKVADLGAGPDPLPQKQLTAEALAAAIRQATTDAAIIEKAGRLGRQIRRENGVSEAVYFIETWMQQQSTS